MTAFDSVADLLRRFLQIIAFACFILIALGMIGYTAACALGHMPWLEMPLRFGPYLFEDAGIYVQSGTTALAVLLCFFLPTNARMMALENSHRSFQIGMRDVTRAYAAAHAADREGAFRMKGEFDSIRERLAFLRDHPDLAELEPSVLEVAAQMSQISRELGETYSERNLARAKDFLIARQQEIVNFNERIEQAKAMAVEIRRWTEAVELEESMANAQLARLCEELADLLPELTPPQSDATPIFTRAATQDLDPLQPDTDDVAELDVDLDNVTPLEKRAAE